MKAKGRKGLRPIGIKLSCFAKALYFAATGVAGTKAVREYRTPNLSLHHKYLAISSDVECGTPVPLWFTALLCGAVLSSPQQFASHLRWPLPKLVKILEGKESLSERDALDLSDALGTTAQFWINFQTEYDLWHAAKDRSPIRAIRRDRPSSNHNSIRP